MHVKLLVLALTFRITANLIEPSNDSPQTAGTPSVELRRGFNAAMYATRDLHQADMWIRNVDRALAIAKEHNTNSATFFLGMEFGFSYRIAEFSRNDASQADNEVRNLVIQGTLARLKYEEGKRKLGVTDADVVRVLNIPISSFAAWKSSAETGDVDHTVVDPTKWLLL
jgi:hypothetical protein